MVGDAVAGGGHPFVLAVLYARDGGFGLIERRDDTFTHECFAFGAVEEDGVCDVIVPEQRRPYETDAARSDRRAAGLRFADAAHAP